MNRSFSREKILAAGRPGDLAGRRGASGPVRPARPRRKWSVTARPATCSTTTTSRRSGTGSVGAQLYPCPRPTPPLVGHTYVTYQPLMPHEFLYTHHRVYKTKHEDAPPTRTSVHWRGAADRYAGHRVHAHAIVRLRRTLNRGSSKTNETFLILAAAAALLAAWGWTNEATAGLGTLKSRVAYRQSQTYPWHGGYYDVAWGMPVAVVVPPTAESQTHLGWGVGATRVTPIQHQFQRAYPGPG